MFRNNKSNFLNELPGSLLQKGGLITYFILGIALVGFEMFNFSTTQYALSDLLGKLEFFGIHWATILAIAFCGIDFAGIGRLFMPEDADHPQRETWYLFGAWLLAATMNAILTWWGVSMDMAGHQLHSTAIIDQKLLMQVVPVFVAAMVWVTRVLLIGSFSVAGRHATARPGRYATQRPVTSYRSPQVSARTPIQAASGYENRTPSSSPSHRPNPLPMSSTPPTQTRTTIQTPPASPEPEYIPDGEATSGSSIPALRPLALSARPSTPAGHQERRF